MENQDKELIELIQNVQKSAEALEIKDPELARLVIDEIDQLVQQKQISNEVGRMLKALPMNKLVSCFDAVQKFLRRRQIAPARRVYASFISFNSILWLFIALAIVILFTVFPDYILTPIGTPLVLVGIFLLCTVPEYVRSWRMYRLAKELNCSFQRREGKVKTFLSIPFEGKRNIIQGTWRGKDILIFDVRRFTRPAPTKRVARAWYILNLDFEMHVLETSINGVAYKNPRSFFGWYPPVSFIKSVLEAMR